MVEEYYIFIDKLGLPDEIRVNFLDERILKESHKFYINLFRYLHPLYPAVLKIDQLTFAAYLHFRFLLIFDNFLDVKGSNSGNNFESLFVGFELYEKSTRELGSLIKDQNFWEVFRNLKKKYFSTIQLEKSISQQKSNFTEDLFHQIAVGKSAICLASVQALESLGGNCVHRDDIIECLEHIHLAFQTVDDIDDFRKDIDEGQWTFIRFQLQNYLQKRKLAFDSSDLQIRYLFTSGLAQESLAKASFHYSKAIAIATSLGLSDLQIYLEEQNKNLGNFNKEIEFLKEKTFKKLSRSGVFMSENSLISAIQNGTEFLKKNLSREGFWRDFYTSAGEGSTWTTAYVGFQLAEYQGCDEFLAKVLKKVDSAKGSYNDSIFQDGDSMNFVVAFIKATGKSIPAATKSKWLAFVNKDGGWTTYRDEAQLRAQLDLNQDISVQGWMNAQTCVTATAAYVLSFLEEPFERQYDKTCRYLLSQIKKEGCWHSYWWTSPVYATSFAILALCSSRKYRAICKKAVSWLLKNQESAGFWKNTLTGEESPFYTALAIKAIASYDYRVYESEIQKAVEYLLKKQTDEGSWISNRILRIPSTQIDEPADVDRWRKSSFGVNCIVDDHNRLFSTSTIVNALGYIQLKCK